MSVFASAAAASVAHEIDRLCEEDPLCSGKRWQGMGLEAVMLVLLSLLL